MANPMNAMLVLVLFPSNVSSSVYSPFLQAGAILLDAFFARYWCVFCFVRRTKLKPFLLLAVAGSGRLAVVAEGR
jgi:hypothetical protein